MAELQTWHGEADYGPWEAAMQAYQEAGTRRAFELGNRGPVRYDAAGNLDQSILDAYWRCGFYVFTGVLSEAELADIQGDVDDILTRIPSGPGVEVDGKGRPALGIGNKGRNLVWVKPLSDPSGGTDRVGGRHPYKMFEPTPAADAPDHVLQLILGSLQYSDACLRVYAHPDLLRVAEAINGPDFTPFNEGIWFKWPGLGGSVAWHQDGTTQWDRSDFDLGTHGFNFMAQLHGCNAANGLWVVPGSHDSKKDIKAMCEAEGSDRLPTAVPLICDPGDVAITNRQAIHGSFANTSPDLRVTINFGFHRHASVLGASGNGIHSASSTYDETRIFERSKMIAYGINSRKERFPAEQAYQYAPFAGILDQYHVSEATRPLMKDYNLLDLGI